MDIFISKTTEPKRKPLEQEEAGALGFGNYFTDHMFLMNYDEELGWHDPRIEPYHNLSLDPASAALHYGQEIFEGMKAYRSKNDDILFFRPEMNAKRWNISAERMCMPRIDPDDYIEALNAIVDIDRDWTPHKKGSSLVLRPTMIATDACLGVHASKSYIFYIICSPSDSYFKNGASPVNIYVEEKYIRAASGGTGFAKCGGNYAGSLLAAKEAEKKGYEQVLWLDAVEHKYIEEVGGMNMFFVIDNTIITAPLHNTILAGVTRDSIITLARNAGYNVEERKLSIDEIVEAHKSGKLQEAFGTGTAAVVAPVGKLHYKGEDIIINNFETGEIAYSLYDQLINIQLGIYEDKFGWVKMCSRLDR